MYAAPRSLNEGAQENAERAFFLLLAGDTAFEGGLGLGVEVIHSLLLLCRLLCVCVAPSLKICCVCVVWLVCVTR